MCHPRKSGEQKEAPEDKKLWGEHISSKEKWGMKRAG
jgi:hypothetical protein